MNRNRNSIPYRARTRGQDVWLALFVCAAFLAFLTALAHAIKGRGYWEISGDLGTACMWLWIASLKRAQWECPMNHDAENLR